jgi:mannose-6-phosphate isomerase-like protein (cupin superfamily)
MTMPAMNNINPTTFTEPVVQTLEQAATQAVLGGSITVRLRAEQTDGQLGLIEQVVPGGFPGPALHVHPDFDEIFYVIGPGTVAFVPRGTPHTFANPGPEPARSLVAVTPGGFEAYFGALIELISTTGGLPPEPELRDLGIAYGSRPA